MSDLIRVALFFFGLIGSVLSPSLVFSQAISDSVAPSYDLNLSFTSLAEGQHSAIEIVTISNSSSLSALTLSNIHLSGSEIDQTAFVLDFGAGPRPCLSNSPSIPPGGNCTLGVRFVPKHIGSHSAVLHFSSQNEKIAFHNTKTRGISLYDPSTGGEIDLTMPPPGMEDSHPSWSPDARQIVFVRHNAGSDNRGSLMIVIVGQPLNMTALVTNAGTPSWSPDGRRIVYRNDNFGGLHFYDITLGRPIEHTIGSGEERLNPTWSPAGTQLVSQCGLCALSGSEIHRELLDFDAVTGELEVVSPINIVSNAGITPAWSPDGEKIAFQNTATRAIDLVDLDGFALGSITQPFSSDEDKNPSWSPDSKQIVFQRSSGLNNRIVMVKVDGTGGLVTIPEMGRTPAWSPGLPPLNLSGSGLAGGTNSPPSAPQLLSPNDGHSVLGTSVTLSWQPSADPDG